MLVARRAPQLAQASQRRCYRRITPTGTSFDGDVIFAVCPLDGPSAPPPQVEAVAVAALGMAIERAVRLAWVAMGSLVSRIGRAEVSQSVREDANVVTVRASIAPLHAEARVSSVQISQRLAGHPITILETRGDWLQVRGEDAYEGWIHRGYIEYRRACDAGCSSAPVVRLSCGRRHTDVVRPLPLGAWVAA